MTILRIFVVFQFMASNKIGNYNQQQMLSSGTSGGVMQRNSSSRPPPLPQQRNSQHSNPMISNNYCNNMDTQYHVQNSQPIGNSVLHNVPGYLSSPAIHAAVYAASNTSNHSGGNHGDVHRNDGANNFATIRTTSIVTKQQKEHMQVK